MNDELNKLKEKLEKDAKQSLFRQSELQKEIQELVQNRKEAKAILDQQVKEWEEKDQLLEGSITEIVEELAGIQQRELQAQELIKHLESINS